MAKTVKPLRDYVVVQPVSKEETTASGIVLPDTVKGEKPQEGKVINVGPGKMDDKGNRIKMEVKVGDTVLFSKYSPDEIEIDGKEYLILTESDIKAIIS